MKTFGDRLRDARLAAGLTQEQLGFRLDVTKSSVSAWENNREAPSFALLPKLASTLSSSLDALVLGLAGNMVISEGVSRFPTERIVNTAQEFALLTRFRHMSAERREALLVLMRPDVER